MGRLLTAACVLAAALLPLAASAQDAGLDPTLANIAKTHTVRLGYREASPPFSFLDQANRPIGYSLELCEAIVEEIGTEVDDANLKIDAELSDMLGKSGRAMLDALVAGETDPVRLAALAHPNVKSPQAKLAAIEGSGPFGPEGHAMSGYLSLPAAWREDASLAATWVDKARDHVGGLPPKVKKPKAAKPKKG